MTNGYPTFTRFWTWKERDNVEFCLPLLIGGTQRSQRTGSDKNSHPLPLLPVPLGSHLQAVRKWDRKNRPDSYQIWQSFPFGREKAISMPVKNKLRHTNLGESSFEHLGQNQSIRSRNAGHTQKQTKRIITKQPKEIV